MDYFLATGNLISRAGLDLKQVNGYSIVAEKLNFRYNADEEKNVKEWLLKSYESREQITKN